MKDRGQLQNTSHTLSSYYKTALNQNHYLNPNVRKQEIWTQVLQLCGSVGCILQLRQR